MSPTEFFFPLQWNDKINENVKLNEDDNDENKQGYSIGTWLVVRFYFLHPDLKNKLQRPLFKEEATCFTDFADLLTSFTDVAVVVVVEVVLVVGNVANLWL